MKLEKCFFQPICNKFAIQNNTLMHLTFHNTNSESENFNVLVDLAVFKQLRKLWREGANKFILYLSLFMAVHIM